MTDLPNIAITGHLRSGKDELGNRLSQRYGYVRFAFGDGIKDVCRRLYPEQFTDGKKPRALLQGVGQALRQYDPDVWVRQCFDKITWDEEGGPYVITDLRQPNEYTRCRREGFVIIRVKAKSALRIHRAATGGDTFKLADLTHETESHVDGFAVDYEITNDGTLDELYAKVDEIMAELLLRNRRHYDVGV
ncbi:AAA family ATPase [Paenibacillus sp. CAU 1782]